MSSVGNSVIMSQVRGLSAERASTTSKYEADTLVIPANQTDYDVKEVSSRLFNKINVIREMTLRVKSGNIAFRLNAVDQDPIDLLRDEIFTLEGFPVTNIYVTTSSDEATVRIVMIGWN